MLTVLSIVAASALLWLAALLRLDPHRGEKGTSRRVAGFFLLGMLSIVPVSVMYLLHPYGLMLLGVPLWDEFVYQVCAVGPIEESGKFLVFALLARRFRTIREPLDGVYQAAAVGLGFAIVENVSYGLDYGPLIACLRSCVTPLAHMTYAAIWGFVFAARVWGCPRRTARDRAAVLLAVLPAAFVHGFANFLAQFGPAILCFDALCAAGAFLVLRRLRPESPFGARDLRRPAEALAVIGASLALEPDSPPLHLRAAHLRLRGGDPAAAVAHLDRCLASRPEDPYLVGLKGAAIMLSGARDDGERLLARAEASMTTRDRLAFRRNLRRILAPGRGRRDGGFPESMLRTWLVVSDLNRERMDPRPRAPARLMGA